MYIRAGAVEVAAGEVAIYSSLFDTRAVATAITSAINRHIEKSPTPYAFQSAHVIAWVDESSVGVCVYPKDADYIADLQRKYPSYMRLFDLGRVDDLAMLQDFDYIELDI